ncbi:MAG TPA: hypothetical protein VJ866_06160 [Pyrinomonadaceae bacterium]|nr:hypothetical protein [Pyrinomonadaceae bacterium]
MRKRTFTLSLCMLALCACAAPEPPKEEQRADATTTQSPPATASPAASPTDAASSAGAAAGAQAQTTPVASRVVSPPPGAQEVRAAVERIYKGAVSTEAGASAVGDFNGDGSEDLVVRARPAPNRLAELNDEVANWIVTDPRTVRPPDPREFDPHQGVQKLAPRTTRPQIEAGDALLVVVHGYKEAGWRNPEALQTYLLKGATGADLRAEAREEARANARKPAPRLLGDVLREKLDGEEGFLYWTGATYGWYR